MKNVVITLSLLLLMFSAETARSEGPQAGEGISKESRCPVCGMFVAKYPQWLTQLNMTDGSSQIFDGVKDMMAYYFSPQQYGAAPQIAVEEIFVKDYYSQKWIDGRKAFFVLDSDVYGPMGHELIPFAERAAAESFVKDHQGTALYSFSAMTADLIESLRKGHKMKGHNMKEQSMQGHTLPDHGKPKKNN